MKNRTSNSIRLITYSLLGIFFFFIEIEFTWLNKGLKTIPIDHILQSIIKNKDLEKFILGYLLLAVAFGAIRPFVTKAYKKDVSTFIFSTLKVFGFILLVGYIFHFLPPILMTETPNSIPFIVTKLMIPVGVVVPIGAILLSFISDYGLMEFMGVFCRPIMRPIWKTPGRSAVDIVASFIGSYSVGLLITNKMYKEAKYSTKESIIIATGFSTVSVSFMIIIAKTLDIMQHWTLFFWSTLIITFTVSALVARIPPISRKKNDYYNNQEGEKEIAIEGNIFKTAWNEALAAAAKTPPLKSSIKRNAIDGLLMISSILPSIISIALIGLLLANYTPIFDWLSYIFLPLTYILPFPEPELLAKAAVLELPEMFLPAAHVASMNADLGTRFMTAILSISSILFFSASIPCILSTAIPISVKDILIIWFERTVFTLLLSVPFVYGIINYLI